MKKSIIFALNTLGWLAVLLALVMGCVRAVGADPQLYHRLQTKADILAYAGISDQDLMDLDARLADYLFAPMDADPAFDNRPLPVFGQSQPPFNAKELTHLADCRKLLAPTADLRLLAGLIAVGVALLLCGGRRGLRPGPLWLASSLILLPITFLGLWAVMDFNAAFNFFHRIFFTNDLWLLDPDTDLLIRICPSTMFAHMGLRIALQSAAALLGLPLLLSAVSALQKRKRK